MIHCQICSVSSCLIKQMCISEVDLWIRQLACKVSGMFTACTSSKQCYKAINWRSKLSLAIGVDNIRQDSDTWSSRSMPLSVHESAWANQQPKRSHGLPLLRRSYGQWVPYMSQRKTEPLLGSKRWSTRLLTNRNYHETTGEENITYKF
jgi:hypothetical protein